MEEIKTEETVQKKRLITRSDFDGLVCAMLLKELDMIDEIKFVHPKDVQDGKVDINENDITTHDKGELESYTITMVVKRSSRGCPKRSWKLSIRETVRILQRTKF